jgi:hypothetical protein
VVVHTVDVEVGGEGLGGELWIVVAEHPGELNPDPGQAVGDVVDEGGRILGRLVSGGQARDRIAGGGVDGGELPDRPDAFAFDLPT